MTETTEQYIDRYRKIYESIGGVYCKALGKTVGFTMPGFKHLVYKNNRKRPIKVIKNRLRLIPLTVPVVKKAEEVLEIRIRKEMHDGNTVSVRYEELELSFIDKGIKVKVVVRTIGIKGSPHFFSVMKN